jgi:hypothetical protein
VLREVNLALHNKHTEELAVREVLIIEYASVPLSTRQFPDQNKDKGPIEQYSLAGGTELSGCR